MATKFHIPGRRDWSSLQTHKITVHTIWSQNFHLCMCSIHFPMRQDHYFSIRAKHLKKKSGLQCLINRFYADIVIMNLNI